VYRFEGEYRLRAKVWASDENVLSGVFVNKVLRRLLGPENEAEA
jgi:hypothetical protein